MSSSRPLTVGAGIIAVGVLAALPFARFGGDAAPTRPALAPGVSDVPLHLTAESAPSPAVGLHDHDAPATPAASRIPVLSESRLEVSGAPPNLPERYEPLVDTTPGITPAPAPMPPQAAPIPLRPMRARGPLRLEEPRLRVRPAESGAEEIAPPAREQTHRIVDGDTLARIAQRYWGDASLADALFEANRAVLPTADPLPLGVVLKIPPKPAPPSAPSAPSEALPAALTQPKQAPETLPPPVEELPPPVRQPTSSRQEEGSGDELELDEPLAPIPPGALQK